MPELTIDNMRVEVPEGATILQAARQLGIDVPTLCYYEPVGPSTTCMVCLVRVTGRDNFVPACSTRVADGMVVESQSEEVRAARRAALELLLSDHVGDCMAPCHRLCPAGLNIPLMIRQLAEERFGDALETVRRRIALPAVLGRICPAPCESRCRRAQHDAAVAICLLKRFAADVEILRGSRGVPPRPARTGKDVAVVGAGAAGLSAAYYLGRMGHAVTVFDANSEPGGTLRIALAERGLPQDALETEIEMIRNMGVAFHQGVLVGRDIAVEQILRQCDAVLLATGEPKQERENVLGVATAGGRIVADRSTYATDREGVFAAGAAARKITRMAVRACGDGREAAERIDQYLAGRDVAGPPRRMSVHMGSLREGELEEFLASASGLPRVSPTGGAAAGFRAEEAVAEAKRCLHCDCRNPVRCKLRRYAEQYQARPGRYRADRRPFEHDLSHNEVIYEPGKCIFCGTCVKLCEQAGEEYGLTYVGRGFNVRVGVPFGGKLSNGLGKVAEQCVDACPTGALAFKDDNRNEYEA
ncbi:MAG: FAD-dependent oxidoreductase [Planctomycetota bacterium]|jgi:NADPH-dependent glutamate synthase beta subunit-like oxidoreductase/NAD-dependent dihydropyrimidine dehydrogenase PreA subunit